MPITWLTTICTPPLIWSTAPSPITENHRPQSSPRVSPPTCHLWSQTTLTLTQCSPVTNLIDHTIPDSQINPTPISHSFPKSDFINLQSLTLMDPSPHYQSSRLITALICFLTCSSVIRSLNAGQGLALDRCHIHIGELSCFLSGWAKCGAPEPTLFRTERFCPPCLPGGFVQEAIWPLPGTVPKWESPSWESKQFRTLGRILFIQSQ